MAPTIHPEQVFIPGILPPGTGRIIIAYSGGLDSRVLLQLLHEYRVRLSADLLAVHVNHGLSAGAGAWAAHCRETCGGLGVAFALVELDARAPKGESQEAWARKLRYQALAPYIRRDDVLYTAHHMDDQAETLLIQLFRGAGPTGLAAIPAVKRFGEGLHARPLLGYTRAELAGYAVERGLAWIEDESNLDERHDRNFLRGRALPLLQQRWPAIARTLARAARHQADAAALLQDLAAMDIAACAIDGTGHLRVSPLLALSRARAINALRHWIKSAGRAVPAENRIARIVEDVLGAGPGAEPCIGVDGACIRRYRDVLYLTAPLPDAGRRPREADWGPEQAIELELGSLSASRGRGRGLRAAACETARLSLRFRSGGETLRRGGHRHDLKKIFQELGIPACYRDHLPLIYIDDRLAAVADLCIDEDFAAGEGEESFELKWEQLPEYPLP